MAITITYRASGVDVAPSAPNIDYIQWDSDTVAFDQITTSVDVVWGGVQTHYAPYLVGGPPNITYYTQYRISVSHTAGAVLTLISHALTGDIYASGGTGVLVSVTPADAANPFGPASITAGFGPLAADLQNVSATSFSGAAAFTAGTRGIAIDIPTAGQWALQKLALRPAPENRQ